MGDGFAGVDLDAGVGALESTGNENSEPRGEETRQPDVVTGQREAGKSQTADIPDLDKLESFRFNGRNLTPKELRESFMRREDYTRKTQEVAEARKYADNFHADLQSVLGDPRLMEQLRQIYPADYVQIAERVLGQLQPKQENQQSQQNQIQLPKEVMDKLNKVDVWEKEMQERSTQATLEQIESLHTRLGEKFPYADPDVVDARIGMAIDKGLKITKDNIGKVWENAYKMHHDAIKSRVDSQAKQKVEDQVKAGKQARDVGAGSSPPATAPKKYKKFSEINKDVFSAFGK